MAEEYQQQQSNICNKNWWSNTSSTNNPSGGSSNNRYGSGSSGAEDPSVGHDMNKMGMIRSANSVSVSGSPSSMMFLNTVQKMPPGTVPSSSLGGSDDQHGGVLVDNNLQMIGLGLSTQGLDRDQALLRGGKADQSSFRSMLQEDHMSSSTNFQQEIQWKPGKMFATHAEDQSSLNRSGFSLEQPQFSSPTDQENSTITCRQNMSSNYMENSPSIVYGGSPSSMLQSLLGSNSNNQLQQQQTTFFDQRTMEDYSNYGTANYGMNSSESQFMPPASSFQFPQFLRNSPPKQQTSPQDELQFSNNAPYWNASSASKVEPDVRASFMPSSSQPQFPTTSSNSSFEDQKPAAKNNLTEVISIDSSLATKKSGYEASTKRPRNESSSSTFLPPFKVKKEKILGDRITTLQQLVSPFGKTDTASVLSDSIEYIKILHEQVLVFTAPYMKNGAIMQHHHQQHLEKSTSRDHWKQGPKQQDLRSRGLCLVPLSSTFQVTHETSVDFWSPTFGGPLR